MLRRLAICFVLCAMMPQVHAATDLAQINAQIKQTEQQNKKLEEKVKSSDRDIEKTKKKLVRAADQVSSLEEQRAAGEGDHYRSAADHRDDRDHRLAVAQGEEVGEVGQ